MIPVIDMHCDTISGILHSKEKNSPVSLRENDWHIDLLRMKKAGYMCQSFALFTHLGGLRKAGISPFSYAMKMSDVFDEEIGKNSDLILPVTTASQIEENFKNGKMSALKTIEEGGVLEGKVENLEKFYEKGVRKATLTWNFENELAFPNRFEEDPTKHTMNLIPDNENGLKPCGFEMIHAMEDLGVIIDVSHLNDAGIRDILETVKPETPVIASHSNARAVCGHARNLTDEFLKKIADHGGLTGLNFCADFVSEECGKNNRATLDALVRHVLYVKNTAGIDTMGLGTDFDGIGNEVEINGCGEMQKLADALSAAGLTTDEIEKVMYKNALRVYREVLG